MAMSIITTHSFVEVSIDQKLQFQTDPQWREGISVQDAEALLRGQAVFTYISHSAGEANSYLLSWVTESGEVAHRQIRLELDSVTGTPYYRNCSTVNFPNGTMGEKGQLRQLFSKIIGCDEGQLRTLHA